MLTIWKYPLEIKDVQEIEMPGGPEGPAALHVGLDPQGVPCIWVEVDADYSKKLHKVFIVGTGGPVPPESSDHIGSFVQGPFVWHVYI